ncbi:MAG TPA: DsrE family protein [Armatimonadota bacterium]|jgi:uncharacterized protein involved in oxidation of intracellular sulfur
MHLALILNSLNAETMSNAFRLGAFSLASGDAVTVFLMGEAVEIGRADDSWFGLPGKARAFIHEGGDVLACGTCLQNHGLGASDIYQTSDMKALHDLIGRADRVLSF